MHHDFVFIKIVFILGFLDAYNYLKTMLVRFVLGWSHIDVVAEAGIGCSGAASRASINHKELTPD